VGAGGTSNINTFNVVIVRLSMFCFTRYCKETTVRSFSNSFSVQTFTIESIE